MKKCKYCQSEIDEKAKICPVCKKKQKGHGCLITIIIFILLIIVISSSDNSKNNQDIVNTENTATETTVSNTKQTGNEQSTPKSYKSGQYKVGTDIPAGEYVLIAKNSLAYLEIASDSTGKFESIVANDNFYNRSYISVVDGQYLKFSSATLYALADAPKVDTSNGSLPSGQYKIGTDIPAGEYKVSTDKEIVEGLDSYIEVSKDCSHKFGSIISNDNFTGDHYITVYDGQYLKLQNCILQLN